MRCFRPQIEALLLHRDRVVAQSGRPLAEVLEDRSLEVTGSVPVDVEAWAGTLEREQRRRALTRLPAPERPLAG